MTKFFLLLASLFGFLGVAIGAFGAHKLKPYLLQTERLETFETAVKYQFYHTFALIAVALLLLRFEGNKTLEWSGIMFAIGIFVFSGSLYVLCATNVGKWGAVTPFGGVMFMIGWALMAYFVFKNL